MVQRNVRQGRRKAKAARPRKRAARTATRKRPPRKAVRAVAASGRRVAELEEENRRLREELAALRAGLAEPSTPAPGGEPGEGTPAPEA